jgi:sugar phosphate isomerase/epimerase
MIRLGTVAAIGFEDFDPAEWLGLWRRLGCEVVQAYRNQQIEITPERMAEAIAAGGMPCDSLHGVFGEEYDPSCPDEQRRRFAVDAYKAEADLCLALGGRLVVVHCSTVRPHGIGREEKVARTDQLKRSIAELGRHGAGLGVTYAFENLPAYHAIGSDVAELAGLLTEVDAPSTGLCFDSGHANMVGDAVAAARAADGRMVYAHISDNGGDADEHALITHGTTNADALARALHEIGYDGTFLMEVFYKADRLRQLIDEGEGERLARLLAVANGRG